MKILRIILTIGLLGISSTLQARKNIVRGHRQESIDNRVKEHTNQIESLTRMILHMEDVVNTVQSRLTDIENYLNYSSSIISPVDNDFDETKQVVVVEPNVSDF